MLLELSLEALEQRECVRRAAGKPGEYPVVVEAPHLARARLDHDVAEGHLSVAAERYTRAAPHRQDGRAMKNFVAHRYHCEL